MNGVARDFWAEVLDLRSATSPLEERRPRPVRARAKKVLVRRAARREVR